MKREPIVNIANTDSCCQIFFPREFIDAWMGPGEELEAILWVNRLEITKKPGSSRVGSRKTAAGVPDGVVFQFGKVLKDFPKFKATTLHFGVKENTVIIDLSDLSGDTAEQIYKRIYG